MKPGIVFSHGIWADGSCFQKLTEGLSYFAGDLTPEEQGIVWSTHFAPATDLFTQELDGFAWRPKPSWSIVATQDRTVHVPKLSHPKVVLDVIRDAAKS